MNNTKISPGVIVAVDFDGTCVTHEFPNVGKEIPNCVETLKKIVAHGGRLILWTMRSNHVEAPKFTGTAQPNTHNPIIECDVDDYLEHAKKWFAKHEIPLWGCQGNPEQHTWTTSPKCYAHLYIDDAALGCPTVYNPEFTSRPYVNWAEVDKLLFN